MHCLSLLTSNIYSHRPTCFGSSEPISERFVHKEILISTCKTYKFKTLCEVIAICKYIILLLGDRGGTLLKVLCYKSKGRWVDPGWGHWNFSLT